MQSETAESRPREAAKLPGPRLIAWEITRTCNLSCVHCRAASVEQPYPDELTTRECLELLDEVAAFARPIIILTGGEPLLRPDVFEIASYGTARGLRMVLATNGTLIDGPGAQRLKKAGIRRVSISLDGATAQSHDAFRQVEGAFAGALRGINFLKQAGIEFQINTTITRNNLQELATIQKRAVELGAVAHHIFLLVPTGRARDFQDEALAVEDYEQTLEWFYDQCQKVPLQLKATCAPQYYRIMRQRASKEGRRPAAKSHGMDAVTRGCLGGTAFMFISHVGQIQPCGYLEVDCGNVRQSPLKEIWEESAVFKDLRDFNAYKGKCGICEYRRVCGGCRARAFEATGDYLEAEPLCPYRPRAQESARDEAALDEVDRLILNEIQSYFPIEPRPYKVLAERLGFSEAALMHRVQRLKDRNIIRRIGANFNSRRLGYTSTLCAARVPERELDGFVEVVNSFPGITHNYWRDYDYNIWFTLIAPSVEEIDRTLEEISRRTGVSEVITLPAQRIFKIQVDFEV